MQRAPDPGAILLFDGVCNLCNGLVRFVGANDPAGRVAILPLQSPQAAHLVRTGGAATFEDGTVVFFAYGRRYERSDAIVHLVLSLRWPWPAAFAAILIPRPWRDAAYRWVARNRYRWFGRSDVCAVPGATNL